MSPRRGDTRIVDGRLEKFVDDGNAREWQHVTVAVPFEHAGHVYYDCGDLGIFDGNRLACWSRVDLDAYEYRGLID